MSTVPTNRGHMTPGEVLSELLFTSYATNRDAHPEISPKRWAAIFPHGVALEAKYQAEKAIQKARHA